MNIVIASAEAAPLAKRGGLADIVSALAKEWKKMGHNPIIIMPKYKSINTEQYEFIPTDLTLIVPMGYWTEYARLWHGKLPDTEVDVYLVEHNVYYDRNGIYGEDKEYTDNDRRFIFFSRAIMESCKALQFKPDIIHAHDYHTAFTMPFLKTHYRQDEVFEKTAGVYTIHNLGYQGKFEAARAMEFTGFGMTEFYIGSWFEQFGVVNAMKAGIMFADKITTVSPTYAKEIRFDYYSEGLQQELNTRGADLIGVLNGADYELWSPENDKYIPNRYDINSLKNKQLNKEHLLKQHAKSNPDNKPLFAIVSRLAGQKGIELLMNQLEHFLGTGEIQFAMLGSGEKKYETYFKNLNTRYPNDTIIEFGYNESISHNIYSAADFFVIPSRYEPCGLSQMYAMRYGTIPIVRKTGGLADTVEEYSVENSNGCGFSFWEYETGELHKAINRALEVYYDSEKWDQIRKNAMNRRFTANEAATKYIEVFNWAQEKLR
jgi:starch synthase